MQGKTLLHRISMLLLIGMSGCLRQAHRVSIPPEDAPSTMKWSNADEFASQKRFGSPWDLWEATTANGSPLLRHSKDGGKTWKNLHIDPLPSKGALNAVHFPTIKEGWAAGYAEDEQKRRTPLVLHTQDGGDKWEASPLKLELEGEILALAAKANGIAWAIGYTKTPQGETPLILATHNSGTRWRQYTEGLPKKGRLFAVQFTTPGRGWVAGHSPKSPDASFLLQSTDGGASWTPRYPANLTGVRGIFTLANGTLFISGKQGLVKGTPDIRAPHLHTFAVKETAHETTLQGTVQYGDFTHIELEQIEFRLEKSDQWQRIREAKRQDLPQGQFTIQWNPQDYSIPQNTQLHYAVRLHDKSLRLAYTHRVRHTFWNHPQRTNKQQALLVALLALSTYSVVLVALCYLYPPAIWKLAKRIAGTANTPLRNALLALSGISILLSLSRLRLKWLDAYRAGRTNWEELPISLQNLYAEDARCLETWVDKHGGIFWAEVSQTFEKVRQYPFAPIQLHDPTTPNAQTTPACPSKIAPYFDNPQPVITLLGNAGTGKSTLTYQIARWAYQEEKTQYLWTHPALPLMIKGDFDDLFTATLASLQRLASQQVIRPEFLKSLAQSRRILIILEDLSERSPTTQASVSQFLSQEQDIPILITSQSLPNLDGATTLAPCFPNLNAIANFVCQYAQNTSPEKDDSHIAETLAALLREKNTTELWTAQEIVQFMQKKRDVN